MDTTIDFFDTITDPVEGLYKEKGSKFIAYGYRVDNISDVEARLEDIKTIHPKARHVCYAYRIGLHGEEYRINDDGEPSGTAGKPIYNELLSKSYSHILVAVVRYFGGTKLGASGLIQAYKISTKDALDNATTYRQYITDRVSVTYPPAKMGVMYQVLKNQGVTDIENQYDSKPALLFDIRRSESDLIIKKILAEYHGYGVEDITDDFESADLTIKKLEE